MWGSSLRTTASPNAGVASKRQVNHEGKLNTVACRHHHVVSSTCESDGTHKPYVRLQGSSLRHVRRDPGRRLHLPTRRGTRRGFSPTLAGVVLLIRQGKSEGEVEWCAAQEFKELEETGTQTTTKIVRK